MVDASFSSQRQQEDRAAAGLRLLQLFAVALAVILLGLGWVTLRGLGGSKAVPPLPDVHTVSAISVKPSDELLETTKGLQATQQQAVDQLQVVQDQLVAQQAETKKLSEQIATLTETLAALKQSVADIPTPSVATPVPLSKSHHQ
jgi:hypothetical protein